MLSLKNICVNFSYKNVLKGINISFQEGKIYSILGENGAGKSTLAHILCGDLNPTSGDILIDDKKVAFKTPKDAIKKGIICIHQFPLLSNNLTVKENLQIGLDRKTTRNINHNNEIIKNWLPDDCLSKKAFELSDQERFFVSLCGALLKNPSILILDEPPFISKQKLDSLTKNGLTILIITHNLQEALSKSHQIVLLQDGLILKECSSASITEQEISNLLYGISKKVEIPSCVKTENIREEDITHELGKTGIIPSNKKYIASNPNLTILQLITAYNPKGTKTELEKYALSILDKAQVNIKLNEKASSLSGGMLHRLILERELSLNPKTIYLFNPIQGLDVEATEKLYSKLSKLSEAGTSIIFGDNK